MMISRLLLAVALLCAVSYGQVKVTPLLQPHQTFVDQAGAPCAGCTLFSYTAGTTTPAPTYTDASGSAQNTNPIVLSVQGGANIWIDPGVAYKFVLKNPQGTTLWTVDQVTNPSIFSSPSGTQTITQPPGSSLNVNTSGGGTFNYNGSEVVTKSSLVIRFIQPGENIGAVCGMFAASQGTVYVTIPTSVAADTTIPANCKVVVENGGNIAISASVTLTINGPFEAGLYTAFTLAGSGSTQAKVIFGNQSIPGDRPQWFGAKADNVANDSPAIQAAIDAAARSASKIVLMAPGNYRMNDAINVTSSNSAGQLVRSGIAVIGEGRRSTTAGVVLHANNGGILFDLSGSAWTTWRGLYIHNDGTNPSNAAFLQASTNFGEGLHHTFDNMTIEMYQATFTTSFGTVAYIICGSEENTYDANEIYATTPLVITTNYSDISASYPSPFQNANVLAAHSTGVNTFSGETSVVSFDGKGPNVWMDGANTLKFENAYMANVNIGAPGANVDVFYSDNGTEEGMSGQFKVEGKSTFLHIHNGQLYGWQMNVSAGAGIDNSKPWINIEDNSFIFNSNLTINYYLASAFSGKPIWNDPVIGGIPQIANFNIWVNQTQVEYAATTWPNWMRAPGVVNNGWLYLRNVAFPLNSAAIQALSTVTFFYNNGVSSAACSATAWFGMPTWDGTSTITFPSNSGTNAGSIKCTNANPNIGILEQYYPTTGGSPQTISMATQFGQVGGQWIRSRGDGFWVSGSSGVLGLAGTGKALACVDALGNFYRGTATTCP